MPQNLTRMEPAAHCRSFLLRDRSGERLVIARNLSSLCVYIPSTFYANPDTNAPAGAGRSAVRGSSAGDVLR